MKGLEKEDKGKPKRKRLGKKKQVVERLAESRYFERKGK